MNELYERLVESGVLPRAKNPPPPVAAVPLTVEPEETKQTSVQCKNENAVYVYSEQSGANGCVYLITENVVIADGTIKRTYGVQIKNNASDVEETIDDFSTELSATREFVNMLMRKNARPGELCNYALRFLVNTKRQHQTST